MGFTYLFCLDEMSIPGHLNDRKVRVTEGLVGEYETAEREVSANPEEAHSDDEDIEQAEEQERQIIKEGIERKRENDRRQVARKKNLEKKEKKEEKPEQAKKQAEAVEEHNKSKPISKQKQKKIKKMKERYGEMDEEDKELALKLTGVYFIFKAICIVKRT